MKVLVAYASKYGATQGIAERIAQVLTDSGLEVDLRRCGEVHEASDYDAFVIGYFARRGVLGAQLTAPIAVTGITLIISAIALRAWSMMTLGERFRSFEVRAEEQGLETHGPYAMVRHPGYLALVLFDVGMPLLLNSALLLPLLLGPLLAMLRRVSAEEQLLRESYPADYPAYAGRTRRFVPLIY